MIGHKLPNKTKSATVAKPKKFPQLNRPTVLLRYLQSAVTEEDWEMVRLQSAEPHHQSYFFDESKNTNTLFVSLKFSLC
jgi:hypothetical protein